METLLRPFALITALGTIFGLSPSQFVTILIAVIGAAAGIASNRASTRTQREVAATTSRSDVEKEAYVRAKGLLDGTITRLDKENEDLREELVSIKTSHATEIDRCISDGEGLRTDLTDALEQIRLMRQELSGLRSENARLLAQATLSGNAVD